MLMSEGSPPAFDRYGISEFITDWRDGLFVASRRNPLSEYQKGHGCREIVQATQWRELISLAFAERIKADILAMVERDFEEAHGHPPESHGLAT